MPQGGPDGTTPSGRAALLSSLRIKAGAGASAPSEGRAAMLARLKASQSSSSLGMRREESAPSSSPSAGCSQTPARDLEQDLEGETPGVEGVSPPADTGQPPSPVGEGGERVQVLTGALETMKMGEGSAPPVVRKGEAGATIKLSANYIRLELLDENR